MEIHFYKNWSKFIDINSESNYFAGRKKEVQNLFSYIINNESGSILISGERGTGKTSFVYKTISELKIYYKKRETNISFYPILINASQLNLDEQKLKEELIKNIIRRLYSELKNSGNNEIDTLYKKTITKYTLSESKYISTELIEKLTQDEKLELDQKIKGDAIVNFVKIFLTVIGVSGLFISDEIWIKILSIIAIALPSLSINFSLKFLTKMGIKYKRNTSAQEIYEQDNSIGNLENDLNNFLCNNSKYKFVFIIDELDKVNKSDDQNLIFKIIQSFKNLFTLTKANFVFITDQVAYLSLLESDKKHDFSPTLFTNTYYLIEPSLDDLHDYFSQIIEQLKIEDKIYPKGQIPNEIQNNLNDYINYFIFSSKMDFFVLKNFILDHILYNVSNKPLINTTNFVASGVNSQILLKSILLQLLYQIYLQHMRYQLSEMHINKQNLSLLIDFAESILDHQISYKLKTKEISLTNLAGIVQPNVNKDTDDSHFLDFLNLLTRYSLLSQSSVPDSSLFQWTNNKLPKIINKLPRDLFQNEQEFVNHFEYFTQMINDIDDIENNNSFDKYTYISKGRDATQIIGLNIAQIYDKYKIYYSKLRQNIPDFISNDILKRIIKETLDINNSILDRVIFITANLISKYLQSTLTKEFLIGDKTNPQLIISAQALKTAINANSKILYLKDFSKQIVITKDFNISEMNGNDIHTIFEHLKTVFIFNIITDDKHVLSNSIKYTYQIKIGEGDEEKKKIKTKTSSLSNNYIEFYFKNNFQNLLPAIKKIVDWLNEA